jgi:hypothetical protein
MTISTNTLRPGLLVSLKTSLRGNVKYDKVDLNEEHDGAQEKVKWETTRTIDDAAEYDAGKKAQSRASSIIRGVCTKSAFGLLCPEAQAWRLDDAVAQAHAVVDAFNATAQLSRLSVFVIAGKIASDDVEAVRAINSEVRDLIDTMADGMQKLDAKTIRDAADKARDLGNMLSPEASVRVAVAIKTARDAAKQIVKAGEAASIEVDQYAINQLKTQRTAFLDLGEAVEIQRPTSEGRAIDLTPENGNAL